MPILGSVWIAAHKQGLLETGCIVLWQNVLEPIALTEIHAQGFHLVCIVKTMRARKFSAVGLALFGLGMRVRVVTVRSLNVHRGRLLCLGAADVADHKNQDREANSA